MFTCQSMDGVYTFEESIPWKKSISQQLQKRNKHEVNCFSKLIESHTSLVESAGTTKEKSSQLSLQVEALKQDNVQLRLRATDSSQTSERVQALERKLSEVQEERTDLLRRRGENAQRVVDLNNTLQTKDRELSEKEARFIDLETRFQGMTESNDHLQAMATELDATNQMLKDELQALQLTYCKLEERYKELQMHHDDIVSRWMTQKSELADRLNDENDKMFQMQRAKRKVELEDAAKEMQPDIRLSSGSDTMCPRLDGALFGGLATIPSRVLAKQEIHEGEVNALAFSGSGKMFATGGADRKVRLWTESGGVIESKGMLTGSNAPVMSVQFNIEEDMVLAASCDYASRIWTVNDQRPRFTLTGHSNKVMAAKFLHGSSQMVSGSHDRTLKLWDLKKSCACIRTIFAGSSCNDLVTSDLIGSNIISGHFDKCIRFWDTRTETIPNKIELQGRITSLDLSPDGQYLLSCSRDDTLKIIDLRQEKVLRTLCADGFHVAADWARSAFSPDGQYAVAGSTDSAIYIWSTTTGKVETVLKDKDQSGSVMCCSWHPNGNSLFTCDRNRKLLVWF